MRRAARSDPGDLGPLTARGADPEPHRILVVPSETFEGCSIGKRGTGDLTAGRHDHVDQVIEELVAVHEVERSRRLGPGNGPPLDLVGPAEVIPETIVVFPLMEVASRERPVTTLYTIPSAFMAAVRGSP